MDALRGFTIFWIIGGDGLAGSLKEMSAGKDGAWSRLGNLLGDQFTHSAWEGFRFYDLIFPLLIFVTGASIVLSLNGFADKGEKRAAALRILKRSSLLFILGVLYYGGVDQKWPDIRVLGVLQRIALCYLAAAFLFLTLRLRELATVCGSILVAYWALMTFVPIPGNEAGSLRPDANLAWWVDAHFLPGRLWDQTQDPEGLLSTVPAIATCLLGVLAGKLLAWDCGAPWQKSLWLFGSGVAMLFAGYIWSLQFPIIKYLWTSSFVLVAGGYSSMLLAVCHHIADVRQQRKCISAFVWIGANAMTLYIAHHLYDFDALARRFVGGDMGAFLDRHVATGTGNLVASLVGLVLAISIARFLYNRHVFIRV